MPKDHAGTHEENRRKVCLLCFGKTKNMIEMRGKLKMEVKDMFDYDIDDERLPLALCSSCKRDIYRVKNGGVQKKIELPNISGIRPLKRTTRSSGELQCYCHVCNLARMPRTGNFARNGVLPPRKGILVKNSLNTTNIVKSQNTSEKRCCFCLSLIARGKSHKCNLSTRLSNIEKYISVSSSKFKEQVISSLVKQKLVDKQKPKRAGPLLLTQSKGGQPLTIIVNPKAKEIQPPKQQLLSADDFLKIQTNFNLSQKTTCGIASVIRVATKNSKAIESDLKKKLSTKIHSVDEFFSIRKFDFVNIKGNLSTDANEMVVFCNNLDGFIQYIKEKRKSSEVHLKFGIDGGGGFLKVCLSIQSTEKKEHSSKNRRQTFEQGVAAKRFKDSGVKKLFILGLAQCSQENYENVSKLWAAININYFDGTIATDLKLANIMAGIMSHSSRFPCTWCYALKDKLDERGVLRTTGNALQNYMNWIQTGAVKANAKSYKNCIHPPIVNTSIDRTFINIISPPELHLMLGVVNTLFRNMLTDFEKEALAWAKFCNVQREVTHGGTGFKGNACKTLLEKIDILRRDCSLGCLKFVEAFENFRVVVRACFGEYLDPNFRDYIEIFKNSYLSLDIKVTPKVHAVFFHIVDFCNEKQQGLGFFSEQAMESVHFDFNTVWKKYKVPRNHSDYPTRLLRALCEYNSLHV